MEPARQLRGLLGIALLSIITSLLGACGGGADSGPAGGGGPPVGTNSVSLEWVAVTNPSPSGYRVYVGNAPGSYLGYLDAGPATNYTVTGLGSGTYYFAVTAYDAVYNESTYSNEIFRNFP